MTPRNDYQIEMRLAPDEIIVDSFAGGGGASLGIQWALGHGPHIAINHDKEAIALHAANHPDSEHFPEDVWHVDPVEACRGRRVGLMWLSPDCKHFSKAKGGKPVSKKIRGLAWTAVRWAKAVHPRVIVLENVEEFQGWGPVDRVTNRPDPARKGQTFKMFVRRLERLGYDVQWRELRACDYGTPTIRKRFFLIARCDGQPIVWPAPTHGKGHALPWRTAAECIDWSIACPSIFERKKELVENTLKRIARGIKRYVIDSPKPFIVQYHSARRAGDDRIADINNPLRTLTVENRFGVVVPHITKFRTNATGSGIDEPMPTVTANSFIVRPGGAVPLGLVGASLIQTGYGEDKHRNGGAGQSPRVLDIEAPLGTVVGGGVKHALVAAFMAQHNTDVIGHAMTEPVSTIVGKGCTQALVATHIAKHYGGRVGSASDEPLHTVTAESVHHALVASSLVKFKGTAKDGQAIDTPLHTVQASGLHHAEVRAFLTQYNGTAVGQELDRSLNTVPAHDRFGLVVVEGIEYSIADIGMRMLAPRELYRAQGFPESYRIDIEFNGKPLTKTAQVRMCGNSVCPPLAAAIISANLLGTSFVGQPLRERVA